MRDPLHEGKRWLEQAGIDLEAGRTLAERFPALACFHAQQAGEKALKAILYAAGERPVIGHSLGELGGRVAGHSPSFERIRSQVAKLDRYYIPTRYPNGLPEGGDPSTTFDQEDASSALETAGATIAHAASFLQGMRD